MSKIEDMLKGLANQQVKKPYVFIAVALIFTLLMLSSIQNVRLEGDFQKQMPQNLDSIINKNKLTSKFGGTDTAIVIIYIDPDFSGSNSVTDIRDPRVINTLIDLDSQLRDETSIHDITSPALLFRQTGVPQSLGGVKQILSAMPQMQGFFSKDYSAVVMYLSVDVGSSPDKIDKLSAMIEAKVADLSPPPGVKISQTGTPQIIAAIMGMLEEDAFSTMLVAIILISVFLIIIFKGRGALTILPILLAVTWMYGTMAWLDIPLSVATAGVGAMILGLSVEYDIFYVERFKEQYDKLGSYDEALKSALPSIGVSILGASLTTMTGFFALLLSSMPMLQNLGFTLGLGIFYSVIVDIGFNPVFVLMSEKGKEQMRMWRVEKSKRTLKKNGIITDNSKFLKTSDMEDLL